MVLVGSLTYDDIHLADTFSKTIFIKGQKQLIPEPTILMYNCRFKKLDLKQARIEPKCREEREPLPPKCPQKCGIWNICFCFNTHTHTTHTQAVVKINLHCLSFWSFIWKNYKNLSRSFRFPAPWRCFFSSVHLTHFLQGSGQRTGKAMAEASFCAQLLIFVFILIFVSDCCPDGRSKHSPL